MELKNLLNSIYFNIGKEHFMNDVAMAMMNGGKENTQAVNDALTIFCELGYDFYYIECKNNKLALFKVVRNGRSYENLEFCKPKKNAKIYRQIENNKLFLLK